MRSVAGRSAGYLQIWDSGVRCEAPHSRIPKPRRWFRASELSLLRLLAAPKDALDDLGVAQQGQVVPQYVAVAAPRLLAVVLELLRIGRMHAVAGEQRGHLVLAAR